MNDRTAGARQANATRKALALNLTATEARKLSPQMKQLIKAFAAMGINYHSNRKDEWVVVNGAGTAGDFWLTSRGLPFSFLGAGFRVARDPGFLRSIHTSRLIRSLNSLAAVISNT
jgi:hypothetical protein